MTFLIIAVNLVLVSPGVSASGRTPLTAGFDADTANSSQRLERLDEGKFGRLVRARHGHALLVNFWATWCAPCVEEFPDVVRLAAEMKDRNIDFVGVSADDFEDEAAKVIPFIAKQKAPFKFYIAKLEGEDAFIDSVNKKWGGGIPATFVYDAEGRQVTFLLGKQTYERLKSAVLQAIAR